MKRIIRGFGLTTVVIVVIALIVFAYIGYYNGLVDEISNTGASENAALNSKITSCGCFIELMTTYGNQFLANGGSIKDSEYFSSIIYNAETNEFNMDGTIGSEYPAEIGNITGIGPIPQNGIDKQEINLAISYNKFFSDFFKRFPEITWIYYTSQNGFINIYPWVSSKTFKYSEDLKDVAFYRMAAPENNRFGESVWTPVYIDAAGKGQMTTLSSPIYFKDDFKGVLSLDFTTDKLSELLQSKYDGYIVDNDNNIISSSKQSGESTVLSLKEVSGFSDANLQAVSSAKYNSVQKIGNYYIYKARIYDAPWTLLIVEPMYSIVGEALILTLPEIIIGILLLFGYFVFMNLQNAEALLKKASLTDPLTGLNNRRYLDAIIEKEIARADRYKESLSMASLDLDHFKTVNDTWGHPMGDEVLKLVANIVRQSIRESDVIVRMGGEEFAILLPHTDISDAYMVAERARQAIEAESHPIVGKVTASFGVAERQSGETYNSLYRRVDEAMYRAKNSGRNRVITYEEKADNPSVTIKMEWNAAWECGEANIDRQHISIIELGNRLVGMAAASADGVEQQLDVLLEQFSEHFSYEEKIMAAINYPDLDRHKEIHQKLIEKILKIKESSKSGEIKPSLLFSFIMDDAVIGHLLEEDVKFFPYIKK